MTRLSANARDFLPLPVSERLAYPHLNRPRVSFGGITACRRFQITPEERSSRLWAWDRGGAEGATLQPHTQPFTSPSYPSKIKPQDVAAAAPFEVPPEPIPADLHNRVTWRVTQDTLVRQKTNAYELNLSNTNIVLTDEIYKVITHQEDYGCDILYD